MDNLRVSMLGYWSVFGTRNFKEVCTILNLHTLLFRVQNIHDHVKKI